MSVLMKQGHEGPQGAESLFLEKCPGFALASQFKSSN